LPIVAACEIEEVAIPSTESRVAMHGVLSASAQTQVVILERTRSGQVGLIGPPIDLPDNTVSDAGIAETGALVTLTTPGGATLTAVEDIVAFDRGAGIYRFALPGDALVRGAAYRLSVQTAKGEALSAETTIPDGVAVTATGLRTFDRSRDTVVVEWAAVAGARSYLVRIETPYGPRSFFTDETRVRLPGDLRNVDLDDLPRVFIPGFPQAVTISAVDANFYDWYRTHNDAFSGAGVINRVSGGIGVFGSLVRLRFEDLHVVAPQPEPVAGLYRVAGTPTEAEFAPYRSLELYVESGAARGDQGDALSGRCMERPRIGGGDPMKGCLGTLRNGRIELALLSGWSARDTTDILVGEVRGDSIVGEYRLNGGRARFVKER
jgi:hypothetical protein